MSTQRKHARATLVLLVSFGCGGQTTPTTNPPASAVADEKVVESTEAPEPTPAEEAVPPLEEPSPSPEEGPKPEEPETTTEDDLERCAPAQDKLIDIGRLVDASVADHMKRKKKGWVAKCKRRVEEGDAAFIEDLRCVADADDFDGMIRCDGWTDWPGM